ncbi:MAG TPA: biotin--[acetyl-CoA-carboxylase] ligase [Candidatus Tetragenococcus pullicola]|nr:biotin--[acetyl-CoA-carboxylase] ligase [Candidatus Tetragenococcus pullicola]
MNTQQKLLTMLRQSSKTHSGEKLAQELGISRTAVWKAIGELEKKGYQIEHGPTGYRYLTSDVLEPTACASSELLSPHIFLKESTDSTMTDAKKAAISNQEAPALFLAETQTGGHGRFGRPFFSPKGQIYMSLLLYPNQSFEELPQYTILAAVAAALAIDTVTGEKTTIKWVNDIYLNEKKVCGILSEAMSNFETGQIAHVILGMGINFSIAPKAFPVEIKDKAGSLFPDGVTNCSRNELIALIWKNFFELVAALPDQRYLQIYREKSFVLGKMVTFIQQGHTYTGLATEITDTGELVVETTKKKFMLSSGEISLTSIR